MQRTGNALFISVSGVAGARAKALYEELRATLPPRFPGKRIGFLGCPFADESGHAFPLPLLWGAKERAEHATTRLLKCWTRLNEFNVRRLRPALVEYDIVVVKRFGLDSVLYATSCCDDPTHVDEVERMHHALVRMRIVEQGIAPPVYFIPMPSDDVTVLREMFAELVGVPADTLRNFAEHERRMLDRYFDPKLGQNRPHLLGSELSVRDTADKVADFVEFELRQRAAA